MNFVVGSSGLNYLNRDIFRDSGKVKSVTRKNSF